MPKRDAGKHLADNSGKQPNQGDHVLKQNTAKKKTGVRGVVDGEVVTLDMDALYEVTGSMDRATAISMAAHRKGATPTELLEDVNAVFGVF